MSGARTGRALSIQQPWAWLIVNGFKDVENRDWPTNVRGLVGVHAGKKFDHDGYAWVRSEFPQIEMPAPDAFELGGIVGRVRIVDCVQDFDSPWFCGRYGFVVADAPPLPPLARYAHTGTYRRCAGIDCGAVKPAAAFAREDGKGFYAFCGTCRGDGPDSRAAERAAARAAARDAKRAADRQAALERRFFVRQLRKRASA